MADFIPNRDQCRYLILKVLEQAVRDYVSLGDSDISFDTMAWEEAAAFLFDDSYHLVWGDWELTTEQLLELVDLDISWVREQTTKRLERRK